MISSDFELSVFHKTSSGSVLFLQGSLCVLSLCVYVHDPGSSENYEVICKTATSCEHAFHMTSVLIVLITHWMVLIVIHAINVEELWSFFCYR